jgi:hypothetical protein
LDGRRGSGDPRSRRMRGAGFRWINWATGAPQTRRATHRALLAAAAHSGPVHLVVAPLSIARSVRGGPGECTSVSLGTPDAYGGINYQSNAAPSSGS